jgi:peptidoglycan/xylan/chitin deacetylase (PgdA/CDA1 family)
MAFLASCAGSQSAVRTENALPRAAVPAQQAPETPPAPSEVKPETSPIPAEVKSEAKPESPPMPAEVKPKTPVHEVTQPPEIPFPPAIDVAVQRVKQNQPDIEKYFVLDTQTSDITVMENVSEQSEDFVVVYDLMNAVPDGNERFTVSFSVTGKQSDEARRGTLLWDIRTDKSGLLLALDDNYLDVWTQYLDLFDRYGARITFFIQGHADAFCNLALQRGHDVGYHSINHLNLPKVSHEVFVEETTSDIGSWRNAGIPLLSFAYPFGLSESWMHEELLKHFKILRGYGVTFRVYDRATIQQGYISSRAIDNILFKKDEDFEAAIILMFRTLKFIGRERILPLTTHTIADDADWGITPARMEYVLKTARDLRLVFYRYSDLIETEAR